MTLDFFIENYNLKDFTINKVYVKNKKLYLDVIMPIHLDLIANGYRPELDMMQEKTFIFYVDSSDIEYDANSTIKVSLEYIFINKDKLKITLSKVDIG